MLFSYEDEDIERFSNLDECTFVCFSTKKSELAYVHLAFTWLF